MVVTTFSVIFFTLRENKKRKYDRFLRAFEGFFLFLMARAPHTVKTG